MHAATASAQRYLPASHAPDRLQAASRARIGVLRPAPGRRTVTARRFPQVKGAMGHRSGRFSANPGFGHDHDTLDLRFHKQVILENPVIPSAGGNHAR
jgi:hypothetical protein